MSVKHPIISVTGSSGAGTTSVKRTFEQIFRREDVTAAFIEGDAFHRYDRAEMRERIAEEAKTGNKHFSHFGPETNLLEELEELFRSYADSGARQDPPLHPRRRGGSSCYGVDARHLHAVAGPAARIRTCCSTRACTARW